jgi:CRP-like cAMP-binding protein
MESPDTASLTKVALFSDLSQAELDVLATWLEVDELKVGWTLTKEGAAGYAFRVLAEGTADVIIDGAVVATLGAGDFFGELSLLGAGRQTATVTLTSASTVWTMTGTRFRELSHDHPEIADAISKTAEARLDANASGAQPAAG